MSASSHKPLVVLFGRTNVGKSTLFNTLTEHKQALVSDIAGTTRDSNLAEVEWRGHTFDLVDTGGFIDLSYLAKKKVHAETIDEHVQKQARDYLKRADAILFAVDAKDGLLPQDKEMAAILKRILPKHQHVIVIANKVDAIKRRPETSEFYTLGFGSVYPVSAATGTGTGDMLDAVLEQLGEGTAMPERDEEEEEAEAELLANPKERKGTPEAPIRVCIIGKPNVGKSSLLNAILGYNRVIVSPIPHTTREPQSTNFTYKDKSLVIVDTAGITKHGHKSDTLEKFSMDKSFASLQKSDVALIMLDINEEITNQDARLVEEAIDRRKSIIIIANKWDKVDTRDTKKFTRYIHGELPFATYAPIQFISAKNREKIDHLLKLIIEVDNQRHLLISDSQTEKMLKAAVKKHRPTKGRGTRYPRIYEFKQTGTNPPSFMVRVGARESLAETYLRFLENQLRAKFGFLGTPMSMWVKKGREVHGAQGAPGAKVRKD